MNKTRVRAAVLGALALLLIVAAIGWSAPAAAQQGPLRGAIYAWTDGELRPVPDAAVSTGLAQVRTDADGQFQFAADERSGRLSAIKPGFDVVRRDVYGDQVAIVLRELVVRAVFIPFARSHESPVQDWIRDLVERDLINAVVIDIKNESGRVNHFAATAATDAIEATMPDDGMADFLAELGEMGVYRIGRIVTFWDNHYAVRHPQQALQHINGFLFRDGTGNGWASPFSPAARRYNVEIGVAAARHVDEVQYDYVRLPYESGLAERAIHAAMGREAAINTFAEEAATALHLAGAALSFDVFGAVSVSKDDEGIGQSLRSLSQHLDYLSPMLYPSGWAAGSFGLSYPAAHPGLVIRHSMDATMARIAAESDVEVRPWLQDFSDYAGRGVFYSARHVQDQIVEAAERGGYGFMLWDKSLEYQEAALELPDDLVWSPRWAAHLN